jgi:Flp pilus assembly protein TadG
MKYGVPRKFRRQRGSAILEFAIGAMVFWMSFYGVFQFGYAFYVYNNLVSAVDAGAYYAAYRDYDSATSIPSDAFKNAVKNMVVYGSPATGTNAVAPGLTTAEVNVGVSFSNGIPSQITVSLSNYSLNAVFTTFTLNKPTATYPYLGVWNAV